MKCIIPNYCNNHIIYQQQPFYRYYCIIKIANFLVTIVVVVLLLLIVQPQQLQHYFTNINIIVVQASITTIHQQQKSLAFVSTTKFHNKIIRPSLLRRQTLVLPFGIKPNLFHIDSVTSLDSNSKEFVTTTSNQIPSSVSVSPMNVPPVSMTAKRIYWIRHGEVINPGGTKSVYYGSMDVPLSSFGQQEAMIAAQYLANTTSLSAVFSSNLSRAIYGAEQVRLLQPNLVNTSVISLDGFMELDRGIWCGKTIEEIGIDIMQRFDECDESVTPLNGESYRTLYQRVIQTRDNHVLKHIPLGQSATVVSHLQVTRCIVADAKQVPIDKMSKIPVATASITCIDYDYGQSIDNNTNEHIIPQQIVHFQSFKPDVGLRKSKDGAN